MAGESRRAPPWLLDHDPCSEPQPRVGTWILDRLSRASQAVASELEQRGLPLLRAEQVGQRRPTLVQATALIASVPSLEAVARCRVGAVFILDAPADYDISHSEPKWPDWIFVSVPEAGGSVAALRAAENIVHEAMHLHLTALEANQPLVADRDAKLFSPWKGEPRDAQGILHGLYVFECIAEFFRRLDATFTDCEGRSYVRRRLTQIETEMGQVDLYALESILTSSGRRFLRRLHGAVERGLPM